MTEWSMCKNHGNSLCMFLMTAIQSATSPNPHLAQTDPCNMKY